MTINLQKPDITELKPRITVFGVGGGGGNAVNNMINAGLDGVEFVVANTDAQALSMSKAGRVIQMGVAVTEGLGAGSQPEVGRAAAQECIDEINDHLNGTHMCFVTAGMGGGTGTGAAPIVAAAARDRGILTVGVVTKPFHFEGQRRMRIADDGIKELQTAVDTLIVIPNQNLFRIANDKTTFADAFGMADQVLYSGVACITDLMVKEGLINLDFADVRSVMREMGKAMMGTGEASGEGRAMAAAEAAIANPLLDETSMKGAKGLLISITGGRDMTLFEVDEAATRIREEVDADANIILGATFDEELEGLIRVSVVATGIDREVGVEPIEYQPLRTNTQQKITKPAAVLPEPRYEEEEVVEETFKLAEAELEQELSIAVPEAPAASAEDEFKPQSRLFTAPAEPKAAPVSRATPQPVVAQAPAAGIEEDQFDRRRAEAPKMPRIEDFPPIVRAEVEHNRRPADPSSHDERGPMGLLKRISSSLHRREDEEHEAAEAAAPQRAPAERRQLPPETSMYAPRRAATETQQRPAPVQPLQAQSEEDQLEIPAFLRRQAL
jgi:cell division protein FtsZ